MNESCSHMFHHLEVLVESVLRITENLVLEELSYRPDPQKRSLRELLSHMALICEADYRISEEATEKEMADYYNHAEPQSPEGIRTAFRTNLESLRSRYDLFTEAELSETTTSWWGTSDTRFGWLVVILVHMAHHRGQLHAMLVRMGKDPGIQLFE